MIRFIIAALLAFSTGALAQVPGQGGMVPNTPPAIGLGQPIGQKTLTEYPVIAAVPDGTTDNAAAIQAQINAAGAAGSGKVIIPAVTPGTYYGIGSRISNPYSHVTVECSVLTGDVTSPGPCAFKKTQSWQDALTSARVATAGINQVPGNTFPLLGGTSSYSAKVTVSTTQVVSATVNAGGTGCTNGPSQTVTGTTGQGHFFQANVTISGNAITAVNSISYPGFYLTNPTTATSTGAGTEPVTGNSCAGSVLSVVMGIATTDSVTKAIVAVGGTGCTNGSSQTMTGTTGTGTKFTALVTIAGNTITAVNSISNEGNYSVDPTSLFSEPVTGASCTGSTLQLWMTKGVIVQQPGYYLGNAVPANPVSQGTPTGPYIVGSGVTAGSGSGATLTATWGAAMMEVTSVPGAAAQNSGSSVRGISFKCDDNTAAAYGLIVQSMRMMELAWNYAQHCTTAGFYLGTVDLVTNTTVATQQNIFVHNNGIVQTNSLDGDAIWENSTATANQSLLTFETNFLQFNNGHGIRAVGSDNEIYLNTHEVAGSTGAGFGYYATGTPARPSTATQSSTSVRISSGGNTVVGLGHGGVYLDGTSNLQVATIRNQFVGYDVSNPIPLPVADTGATYTGWREDGLFFGNLQFPVLPIGLDAAGSYNAALVWKLANPNPGVGLIGWLGMAITDGTSRCNVNFDANSNFRVQSSANCGVANFSGIGWQDKLRKITSGSSDTAAFNDNIISWASASGAAKAQSIPGCNGAGRLGAKFVIKDQQGDAATSNITVTPTSGTIDGGGTAVINTNKGFLRMNCDGGTNYVLN